LRGFQEGGRGGRRLLRAESGRAKEDGERNGEACSLCCAGEPYEEGSTFSFGVRRRGGVSLAPPPYFSSGVVGWRPCREKSDLMAGPRVGERGVRSERNVGRRERRE
jgi:hypothetical protein